VWVPTLRPNAIQLHSFPVALGPELTEAMVHGDILDSAWMEKASKFLQVLPVPDCRFDQAAPSLAQFWGVVTRCMNQVSLPSDIVGEGSDVPAGFPQT
jgi:hypothetical protein